MQLWWLKAFLRLYWMCAWKPAHLGRKEVITIKHESHIMQFLEISTETVYLHGPVGPPWGPGPIKCDQIFTWRQTISTSLVQLKRGSRPCNWSCRLSLKSESLWAEGMDGRSSMLFLLLSSGVMVQGQVGVDQTDKTCQPDEHCIPSSKCASFQVFSYHFRHRDVSASKIC